MSTFRLFPSTNGPSSGAVSYSGPFIAGVCFAVKGGGNWFNGYYLWVADIVATTPVKCALWVTGNVGSSQFSVVPGSVVTSGTLTSGQWNFIPLSTPVPLSPSYDPNLSTAGGLYIAAIGVNGNFFDTNSSFGSGDTYSAGITNGPLVGYSGQTGSIPAPQSMPQGVFSTAGTDPSTTMPATGDGSGDGSSNFWVDVQVSNAPPAGYSGSYRLYPNNVYANTSTTADASANYNVATEVWLTQTSTINNVWYYSPSGTAQLATWAGVWSVTGPNSGSLVAVNTSPSWSGAAASGWVSTPVSGTLQPGHYKVSVYNSAASPDGWSAKDANTAYFDLGVGSSGITNGPLFAPQMSSAEQAYVFSSGGTGPPVNSTGSLTSGGAQPTFSMPGTGLVMPVYPYLWAGVTCDTDATNSTHSQNYWVDLEVTPASAPPGASFAPPATWLERFRPVRRWVQLAPFPVAASLPVPVSDTDASNAAADAGEQLSIMSFSLGQALVGPAWLTKWGRQRFPRQLQSIFSPFFQAGPAPDTDGVHGQDSEFDFPSDTDASGAGADNGLILVRDADASGRAADLEWTAWPSDFDVSTVERFPAGEFAYWSGPLSSADASNAAVENVGKFPFFSSDASGPETDAGPGAGGTIEQVDIYTFQPPFRFTGGAYSLTVPVPHADPEVDVVRELELWRGERPDGTALRLAAAHAAGRLRFVNSADYGGSHEEEEAASLRVSVHVTLAVTVTLAVG